MIIKTQYITVRTGSEITLLLFLNNESIIIIYYLRNSILKTITLLT